jgi:hypothetical protein
MRSHLIMNEYLLRVAVKQRILEQRSPSARTVLISKNLTSHFLKMLVEQKFMNTLTIVTNVSHKSQ